MAKVENVKNI